MVKRALTLLTSILIALPLLMPFNIYAQDTAIVMGTDVSLVSTTLLKTDQWSFGGGTYTGYYNQFVYHVTVQLDNNYVGYLLLQLDYSYNNNPQSGLRTDSGSVTRRVFINGDTAEFNFAFTSWYSIDPLLRNTTNGTPNAVIQDQGVTLLSELDSIQQIIDILNDLYNSQDQVEGLLNNQLDQLELIVSNTSLANQYLDEINKFRQWDIPFESFNIVHYLMSYGYEIFDYNSYNYYNFPLFIVPQNSNILSFWLSNGSSATIVIGANDTITDSTSIKNNLGIDSSLTVENIKVLDVYYSNNIGYNSYGYLVQFTIRNASGSSIKATLKAVNKNLLIVPIYFNFSPYVKYVSTDFALKYGLTNSLLDDLHLIANGTTASQSAADSSQSANEQLQTDSNTLFQQENGFKSDMQNAMQNVNNTFRLQDMGTKFVSSAQWVRSQYESLTNNTPFASLITFSLITGLALILLGKVYK